MKRHVLPAIDRGILCGPLAALLLAGSPQLGAQTVDRNRSSRPAGRNAAAAEPLVSVRLVSVGTVASGPTGAPLAAFGGADRPLHVGESLTGALFAGSPGNPNLGAHWGATSGEGDEDALYVWRATIQPARVTGEDITLVVDWKRFDAVAEGKREVRAGEHRTITLKSGDRHVLDFVTSSAADSSDCQSALIQVEASLVDDQPLANTTLAYDLWLVDEDEAGRRVTRHMEMAGRQREAMSFRFLPIGWLSDGSLAPADRRPDILMEVSGTLKGRLLANGTVEIAVTPSRSLRFGQVGGGTGYRETVLQARPGETIRMEVPASGPAPVRTHRTSLSLTVRAW